MKQYKTMRRYKVKATVDGVLIEDTVKAVDPHDAVDVFEILNDCYNTGAEVKVKNVEVVE